jgi:hypothetical protein
MCAAQLYDVDMNDPDNNKQHPGYREMTVANIREQSATDHIDIVFLESARFYKLYRQNPNFEQILRLLQEAMAKGSVIDVRLESPHSDIIQGVRDQRSC